MRVAKRGALEVMAEEVYSFREPKTMTSVKAISKTMEDVLLTFHDDIVERNADMIVERWNEDRELDSKELRRVAEAYLTVLSGSGLIEGGLMSGFDNTWRYRITAAGQKLQLQIVHERLKANPLSANELVMLTHLPNDHELTLPEDVYLSEKDKWDAIEKLKERNLVCLVRYDAPAQYRYTHMGYLISQEYNFNTLKKNGLDEDEQKMLLLFFKTAEEHSGMINNDDLVNAGIPKKSIRETKGALEDKHLVTFHFDNRFAYEPELTPSGLRMVKLLLIGKSRRDADENKKTLMELKEKIENSAVTSMT